MPGAARSGGPERSSSSDCRPGIKRPRSLSDRGGFFVDGYEPVRRLRFGLSFQFLEAGHRGGVVAGIDEMHFAGDAGGQIAQQVERRAADLLQGYR